MNIAWNFRRVLRLVLFFVSARGFSPRPSNSAIFGNHLAIFLTYSINHNNLDFTQAVLFPIECLPHIIAWEKFEVYSSHWVFPEWASL